MNILLVVAAAAVVDDYDATEWNNGVSGIH